jgi:PAS domain S-box-containing protein
MKNILPQEELHAIINSSYDGFIIADPNGKILVANKALERHAKIIAEKLRGTNVRDFAKKGKYSRSILDLVHENKKSVSTIERKLFPKPLLITCNPVLDQDREIIKIVINVRDVDELEEMKKKLEEVNNLSEGQYTLREQFERQQIVADSPEIKKAFELARRVAQVDSTVLILGESGVGKEIVAKLIHENSQRVQGPLIKINCGAIPETLLESELFGYEGGAFTGAKKEGKSGLLECAHKGSFFLDEIGDLPLILQGKLLRVLQEREVTRVGGIKARKIDTRIIAATNQNLEKMVKKKRFREDLYFRLNVVPIFVPPLRRRKEDIIALLRFYQKKYNSKYKMKKEFSPQVIEILQDYQWPGNVRELENVVERIFVLCPERLVTTEYLPGYLKNRELENMTEIVVHGIIPLKKAIQEVEKQVLTNAINKYKNTYEVARVLQVSQSTIVRKIKKCRIKFYHQFPKEGISE